MRGVLKKTFFILTIVFFAFSLSYCVEEKPQISTEDFSGAIYKDPSRSIEERVEDLMAKMTLEEKLGQMTQAERSTVDGNQDISKYLLGSVLNGGGSALTAISAQSWREMYDRYQKEALKTRLGIPIIYGVDAVHGHNNVYGAVIFPHNIGLGATRDKELLEEIGRITALEVAATGMDWDFAPAVTVSRDERWGRSYESYSEDPSIVSELGAAYIKGLQGDVLGADQKRVAACAKHFVADGGTRGGIDRGNSIMSEEALRKIHLAPYWDALEAGTATIMVSFSSFNGEKLHGHKKLITDVLKGEMGFQGFIISDWGGVDEVHPRYREAIKKSINAGVDMVMVPYRFQAFLINLKALVASEEIPMSRIDDAVRRILRIKFQLGLFEYPFADKSLIDHVGSKEHREVAREAVRKSMVLLKNKGKLLPLSKNLKKIFVAGKNADNLGAQCGGWTISWQGSEGDITEGTTILEAVKATVSESTGVTYNESGDGAGGHDVAIVVVGEGPYAEMKGDNQDLRLGKFDVMTIEKCVKAGVPTVVILVSGRPLVITDAIGLGDAFVAAWLPGSEGLGVTDVLFGDYNPSGKLSFSWPRNLKQIPINVGDKEYDPLFPIGFGLTY